MAAALATGNGNNAQNCQIGGRCGMLAAAGAAAAGRRAQ